MLKKRLVFECSSARVALHMLTKRGSVLLGQREAPPGEWTENWSAAVSGCAQLLREWVTARRLTGYEVLVVFGRSASTSIISSCPRGADSHAAARLAAIEASSFNAGGASYETYDLSCDSAGAGAQQHVLAMGELDSHLDCLYRLAEDAGLRVIGCVPAAASGLWMAHDHLMRSGSPGARISVYLDTQTAALVAWEDGRIKFARSLPLGFEPVARTLARELAARSAPGIDLTAPLTLLRTVGLPKKGEPIGPTGIPGEAVIPHIQPLLQRMAVELKQSVRFGLSEANRSSAPLSVVGPGAEIAGLPESLAALSGLVPAVGPKPAYGLVAEPMLTAALLPKAVASQRRYHNLKQSVIAGCVVALLAVAGDGVISSWQAKELKTEVARLTSAVESSRSLEAVAERTLQQEQALVALRERLASWAGGASRPDAALVLLADACQQTAVIQEFDYRTDKSGTTTRVRGLAFGDDKQAVQRVVERLTASPLVLDAKIESIRRGGKDASGRDGSLFDLTLRFAPIAAASLQSRLAEEDQR